MKIKLNGPFSSALRYALVKEGNEVVEESPEMIITDTLLEPIKGVAIVGGDYTFPLVVAESLGIPMAQSLPVDFVVSRYYDHGWRDQTLVGVPLLTTMNCGLGSEAPNGVGFAARYIHDGPLLELFDNSKLDAVLSKMPYSGFVSFCGSLSLGNGLFSVTKLSCGIPFYGLYSALEGASTRISDFFSGESPRLLESWTVGLIVTRSPWPFAEVSHRVFIDNLNESVRKHLWLPYITTYKKSAYTDYTFLGVSTSWAKSLGEAGRRVLRTLKNLSVDSKQHRTDLVSVVSQKWHLLQSRGLLGD